MAVTGSVNVEITPTVGDPYTVPQDPNCSGAGWYYDNPALPTSIELCASTCAALKADATAAISILLGCKTVLK